MKENWWRISEVDPKLWCGSPRIAHSGESMSYSYQKPTRPLVQSQLLYSTWWSKLKPAGLPSYKRQSNTRPDHAALAG